MFVLVWLHSLSGELGNHCIHLHVPRLYIAGSSHVMAVSSGKEVVFKQAILCALSKIGKPGMIKKYWQPFVFYHCYPSQETWEIFQLTLNSEQFASVSCIYFGKAETSQRSCRHRASPTVFTPIPVVYLPNTSPCYYLQAQLA